MKILIGKAGFAVCLFLCLLKFADAAPGSTGPGINDQWAFGEKSSRAYDLIFNLDLDAVHRLIPEPKTADEMYVVSLAECIELMLEEDGERYTEFEKRFDERRERKSRGSQAAESFLQAEMNIQWAFVHFKFGHEFDAALNLKDAYTITSQARKRFPNYDALKKTAALLQVIIGSVPEKYNWVLSLLGIEGSVDTGLMLFDELHNSSSPLRFEADMLQGMARCYVLQQTSEASAVYDAVLKDRPSRLAAFLAASVAIKNSESTKALKLLVELDSLKTMQLDYASYLLGEVYLFKAEYLNSITAYRKFLNHYKGQNNIKDAQYKIGLCYWLNGNLNDAKESFRAARNAGRELTEADKYAARSLAEDELPHRKLTQARYFTDGGFYEQAQQTLDNVTQAELITDRDRIEFHYRKARLNHKTNKVAAAKEDYQKVIELNGNGNWYYAPNACLQMGYLLVYEKNNELAEEYFEMALSYKKHEYKNSIDTKARSALSQLKRK
ncbi:tetratricopeptide repeat protein [Chryseolinea sp. T2]|uniref:tetratricopeptide repeat protein n=1 Tax=Chryseolinea sp. T2 TaxID=3129255 RepID=UPI0030778D6D